MSSPPSRLGSMGYPLNEVEALLQKSQVSGSLSLVPRTSGGLDIDRGWRWRLVLLFGRAARRFAK